jgi:preprotein translocase subunit SecE
MGQKQARRRDQAATEELEVVEEAEELDDEEESEESDSRALTAAKGRITPGRRTQEAEGEGGNFFTRLVRGLVGYFEGVRGELRKVTWPTREEARRLTIIVVVALIISSLILGGIGLLFTELFRIGLNTPLVLLAFMVVAVGGGFLFYQFRIRRSSRT